MKWISRCDSLHTDLPSPFSVEEQHEEKLLPGFFSSPLPQFQHVHRRHRDWDAIVKEAFLGHVGVDNLGENECAFQYLGKENVARRQLCHLA